jgi:hypothetical protein
MAADHRRHRNAGKAADRQQALRGQPDSDLVSREAIAAVENGNIHRALLFHLYALVIPALVHAIGWRIAAGLGGRGDGYCNDCGALIRARWCPICRLCALPGFDKLVAEAPSRTFDLEKLVAHPHGMASCGSGRGSRRCLCCPRSWCSRHRFGRRNRAPPRWRGRGGACVWNCRLRGRSAETAPFWAVAEESRLKASSVALDQKLTLRCILHTIGTSEDCPRRSIPSRLAEDVRSCVGSLAIVAAHITRRSGCATTGRDRVRGMRCGQACAVSACVAVVSVVSTVRRRL